MAGKRLLRCFLYVSAITLLSGALWADSGKVTLSCTNANNNNDIRTWMIDYDAQTVTLINTGWSGPANIGDKEITWNIGSSASYRLDRYSGQLYESRGPHANSLYNCEIGRKKF